VATAFAGECGRRFAPEAGAEGTRGGVADGLDEEEEEEEGFCLALGVIIDSKPDTVLTARKASTVRARILAMENCVAAAACLRALSPSFAGVMAGDTATERGDREYGEWGECGERPETFPRLVWLPSEEDLCF
jgi:hypothetical protein